MLSYYCGKKVAYLEDEEYIDDLLKLDVYSEEILDMYYYHDTDYYIDVSIRQTPSCKCHKVFSENLGDFQRYL